MKLTKEIIEQGVKAKGYKWFETGDYNINIVGVRNSDTGTEVTNKFDDKITISFMCDGSWEFYCYDCTTDPGKYWVENIMRKEGVAILKEGQYPGSHKIRLHQGRYEALGQCKDVTVYRDANKDGKFDLSDDEGGATVNLFLEDASDVDWYIMKNVTIPKGVTLVLDDNLAFDSSLYSLKIYNTGTSPALTIIIK